jgi:hypothetical protein
MNNHEISHYYDSETIINENKTQNGGDNKIAHGGFLPIVKCENKKSLQRPVAFEPIKNTNIININDIIKYKIKRS